MVTVSAGELSRETMVLVPPSDVFVDSYKNMTVSNGHLYWISQSGTGISWTLLPNGVGTAAPDSFVKEVGIQAITSDANTIYWATSYALESCPALGCGASGREILVSQALTYLALAVDDVAIYWASGSTTNPVDGTFLTGSVWKLAK